MFNLLRNISAQRTAHSAQRTAHSAQRTAHSLSDNSTQKRDSAIIAQSIFYAHINFRRKFSHNLFGVKPVLLLLLAALALLACDPPKSSTGGGVSGNRDGKRTAARLTQPNSIAGSGNTLYFLQSGTTGVIRRLTVNTAEVTTLVNGGDEYGHANGDGTVARFNWPWGIAINGNTLYVSDTDNHRIREVAIGATAATTIVSDLAGNGEEGHANGAGATAQFNRPTGLAVSGSTLYVSDSGNHRIRAIDLTSKTVRDIAGSGTAGNTDATGAAAQFSGPMGIATDGTTLYIADE